MSAIPCFALAAGAAQPGGSASAIAQILPLVLIFVAFYFLMIRPQQKRMKEHQAQIAAVKKGDQVVTGGGLIGKVTRVEDEHVEVDLVPNMKVRAVKSTLSQVLPLGGAKPAND